MWSLSRTCPVAVIGFTGRPLHDLARSHALAQAETSALTFATHVGKAVAFGSMLILCVLSWQVFSSHARSIGSVMECI